MNVLKQIQTLLNDNSIVIEEDVQTLWSGYGQIIRCKNSKTAQYFIVKVVAPNVNQDHPRGWNTSKSHQRKIKSYQVEASFYQHYSLHINTPNEQALLTNNEYVYCKVPSLIRCVTTDNFTLIVMEDLKHIGFNQRIKHADWNSLKLAIRWLAYFHAKFMGENTNKLWEIGTYWHLATRQDELSSMPASVYKTNAKRIDNTLQHASYQTLLHGDAKFENLCFNLQKDAVAAVDFQYAGRGSGVKDLAYLVGSCLSEEALIKFDNKILTEYLTHLKQALIENNITVNFDNLAQETRTLYPVAWADFYRFLLGWNPQSWKICEFMKHKAEEGLAVVLK